MRNTTTNLLMSSLVFALTCAGCATQDPQERITGSGGTLIRYSSQQITVDMNDKQREVLAALRDREFSTTSPPKGLEAVAAALKTDGYDQIDTETDTGLVRAEKREVLVPKWRAMLRGVLKSKIGILPAKPDHQTTTAMIAVKEYGKGILIRARFERTIWDSNGDSKKNVLIDELTYTSFFSAVGQLLKSSGAKQDQ